MAATDIVSQLISSDILTEVEDDESFGITNEFRTAVNKSKEWLQSADEAEIRDEIQSRGFEHTAATSLEELVEPDVSFVANFLTLHAQLNNDQVDEFIPICLLLQQIDTTPPPDGGAPSMFLPIHGNQLHTVISLADNAIVYIWLDDCDPCDIMQAEYEELFDNTSNEIGLFSIYGPDWSELLQSEFDIVGGPVSLFVKNGQIDTRLYGAHRQSKLEKEIEKLQA